jgi:LL-diaminopimelate aminotransferase
LVFTKRAKQLNKMVTADRLQNINEYYFSKKLQEIEELNKQGEPVLNLGIGSPDLPPHKNVIEVLHSESLKTNTHSYQSYKGSPILRNAIAKWYKKWYHVELSAEKEILPLIGSKEGIMHICMTYLNAGDSALVPNPGYPTYRTAIECAGAKAIDYHLKEENDWLPDFEEIEKHDLSKTKLMWVSYPHMPTGKLPTEELFDQLIAFAKKHSILICHDNPYSFILNDNPASLLNADGAKDVVIELNSLSKSHNMAGWRIGMLCGSADKINDVLKFKSNMDSGMFLPLQLAAAKALELGKEWFDALNKIYMQRRKKVFELLQLLDCKYSKDQAGMFVWAKVNHKWKNSFDLSDEVLYKARVFITPGGIFGSEGNQFIRISLCSPEEKFDEAMNRIKMNMQL